MASKSHQWFTSYGHFTEGVDFAYWGSFFAKGLRSRLVSSERKCCWVTKKTFWVCEFCHILSFVTFWVFEFCHNFELLSLDPIGGASLGRVCACSLRSRLVSSERKCCWVTKKHFEFVSFVTFWVVSNFVFLSFSTILSFWVWSHLEFGHILSFFSFFTFLLFEFGQIFCFWVLSHFGFLSFVTFWVFF